MCKHISTKVGFIVVVSLPPAGRQFRIYVNGVNGRVMGDRILSRTAVGALATALSAPAFFLLPFEVCGFACVQHSLCSRLRVGCRLE